MAQSRNKKKSKSTLVKDILKAARKESREAEIKAYNKPINHAKVEENKKSYKRHKKHRSDEAE